MLKCWEEQPTDRPTFDKLRKTMKEMERKHKVFKESFLKAMGFHLCKSSTLPGL